MKSLALRVLGEFGVDGVEPAALGSKKARLALELLALAAGRPVPPDVMVDALWGESPPARPEDQLAVLMSRLRSVLGRERIEHRDGGYLLHSDWLDSAELANLTDEVERRRAAGNVIGAAAAARIVLSLVRGAGRPPPPGDWAQLRRAEIDRLTGRARLTAAAALLEAGDWIAACDAATALLERDPYEETALRILLRGYVMGGQTATALAAYASARARLADDLGTDPSPETAALYTAILRGELPTTATRPAGGMVRLVGRDEELTFLDATAMRARQGGVSHGRIELVVIEGEAGIGKTTLLQAWAAHREAAGDIVLMVAVRATRPFHTARCPTKRAVRTATPARARRDCGPAWRGCAGAGAAARPGARSATAVGPGGQHARSGRRVQLGSPCAGQTVGARAASDADRRRALGRPGTT